MLLICLLIFMAYGTSPAEAYSANGVPVRALILVDEGNPYADSSSELFERTQRVLNINKIPYDILDISQIDQNTFLDSTSNLRYSVLVILGSGWKIDSAKSQLILEVTDEGMGVVGLAPDSADTDLMPLFGINELGTTWLNSENSPSFQIVKDKFTIAHEGGTIDMGFVYLDHHLLPDAEVVASYGDPGVPAVWTYQYGDGKTVFHNQAGIWERLYWGITLQSILYAMPIGVACPINAGVIEVDDGPRSFYSTEQLQDYYYDFYYNFKEWLKAYNLTASFFVAFSYSGDINDFWANPEGLEWANDIIQSGYELGLHCGSEHTPLKVAYWGSQAVIDAEVDEMMQALEVLRSRLDNEYSTQLGEVISYVAPMNEMGNYGYEALDKGTNIRYVGTYFSSDNQALDKVTGRDFAWEGDLDIYNLPRIEAAFYDFNQPQYKEYSHDWMTLRSVIESGDSFLIFTHPDEAELLDEGEFPNSSVAGIFEGCKVWADYICSHYPYYRWWTASELGHYLENREGVLDAEWLPEANTLELRLSQPDDTVHIKTDLYLQKITQEAGTLSFVMGNVPCDLQSDDYDIIKVGQDYFVYAKDSKSSMPVKPKVPFSFKHTSITTTESHNIPGDSAALPLPTTKSNNMADDNVALPLPTTKSNNMADDNAALPLPTLLCIAIACVILVAGGVIVRRIRRE